MISEYGTYKLKRLMRISQLNLLLILSLLRMGVCENQACKDPCYRPEVNLNCPVNSLHPQIDSYTLHMTVHPHLDAFWIFDFEGYYNPPSNRGDILSYFGQNRFHSVKQIFNTAMNVLNQSKEFRQTYGEVHEKAHRTFMNSEMGFFKRWYDEQPQENKATVKELLKTKYWEILGGGYVENDEACAYYDDIIDNYQLGSHYLETEFNYFPKVAISADSFGHSQSMAALLSHFGIQAFLVERSDEHILTKSKTEFMWKALSANGQYYGAIPTHIRWAIHGFEDQFIPSGNIYPVCTNKGSYIQNVRTETEFLKKILNQNHIIRYFGHDFQQFNDQSYRVIEGFMKQFSKQKCNRVIATYTNPTEYFKILYKQVYEKDVKKMDSRSEDIFPIWDYDSGLYWTGYFTTDPFHKKHYRDAGRFLQMVRKIFVSTYTGDEKSVANIEKYELIQRFEEEVAYVQHHDGITGTSKYTVLDGVEKKLNQFKQKLSRKIFDDVFEFEFPQGLGDRVFECYLDIDCVIPSQAPESIYVKIFNSGGARTEPLKIYLPAGVYYTADETDSQTVCLCYDLPCNCTLYLYPRLSTFSFIKLTKSKTVPVTYTLQPLQNHSLLSTNKTHITLKINHKEYRISYKRVVAESTPRNYAHLSRYGSSVQRSFSINSGKYALGNNPNKIHEWSSVKDVSVVNTPSLSIFLVEWNRPGFRTVLTVNKSKTTTWKVETISSASSYKLYDYFLVVDSKIKNGKVFYTDSNGWLVMRRELFHHEDYQAHFDPHKFDDIDGNTYPITAFAYIEDHSDKVSINTDRAQGCIGYKEGSIWVNFDRLSVDDGKWVYENTFRSEYQKFTHWISVQNTNYEERTIQKMYDQGLYLQAHELPEVSRIEDITEEWKARTDWATLSQIDNLKFNVRAWNDSSLLLRVHNLHDKANVSFTLFAGKTSTFLTSFYGRELMFDSIYEVNLLGNMRYETFLDNKWNWNKVMSTEKQNDIFNKKFAENITMRPLELRAFKLVNPRFAKECRDVKNLQYTQQSRAFILSTTKPFVQLEKNQLEEDARNYLLYGDHCDPNSSFDKQQFIPLSEKKLAQTPGHSTSSTTGSNSAAPVVEPNLKPKAEQQQTQLPEQSKSHTPIPAEPKQQPVEQSKPNPSPKPVEPTKPFEVKPQVEQKPASLEPVKPVEPIKPIEQKPVEPVKPKPPAQQKPVPPRKPRKPTTPEQPAANPKNPIKKPSEPVEPTPVPQPQKPIELSEKPASSTTKLTYKQLKQLVNKGVMLTKQQKQIYFKQRLKELKAQTDCAS